MLTRYRPGGEMIVADLFDRVGDSHARQRSPMSAGGAENGFDQFMAQARSGSIVHCDVLAFRGHELERSGDGLGPGLRLRRSP